MLEVQSTADGRGYVRAVFSRRQGGHAAPLDLVRAHLRAVGIRRRCRDAFAGYLVTDADDEALRALEAVPVPAFSERRAFYRGKADALCMTGGEGEAGRFAGGLDAPLQIAAGYSKRFVNLSGCGGDDLAAPGFVFRRGVLS